MGRKFSFPPLRRQHAARRSSDAAFNRKTSGRKVYFDFAFCTRLESCQRYLIKINYVVLQMIEIKTLRNFLRVPLIDRVEMFGLLLLTLLA